MVLNWIKCNEGEWCHLDGINLDNQHFDDLEGVYIIWYDDFGPVTVYVGQGTIRDRLAVHRRDKVQEFIHTGILVTWAIALESLRDGIEAYLARKLNPLIGSRHPDCTEIEVNLPWKL